MRKIAFLIAISLVLSTFPFVIPTIMASDGASNAPGLFLRWPPNATDTFTRNITLGWYRVENAEKYSLQVDNDIDFSSPEINVLTADTQFTPQSCLNEVTYYWRVEAYKNDGTRTWLWDGSAQFTVHILSDSEPGNDPDLGITAQQQHKDTNMLCLDGCSFSGVHAWNVNHGTRGCTHDDMYCARASISMIASYYGGTLSQDRISYEGFGTGAPEGDLGHGIGMWPHVIGRSGIPAIDWALNLPAGSVPRVVGKPTFSQVKNWIDNARPILAIIPSGGGTHAVVIDGYDDPDNTPNTADDRIHVIDPWTGTESIFAFASYSFNSYYVPPSGAAARSNEQSLTQDSDGDGIVDFDETNRFKTDPNDPDSDGDLVRDHEEVRCYTFESDDSFDSDDSRKPDPDNDGLRAELDYDSDNGGASDGMEDLNRNGKVDTGETDPLNPNDDPATKFAYIYCTWGMSTMQGEINYLHSLNPNKYLFDWYNQNNIGNLWANLGKYKAILADEDTFYSDSSWSQYGGPIYNSFKSHASDLDNFVRNGGGIFTSGENDLYKTQAWDWLPTGMQVTSYDPESTSNVHIVFDPGTPKGLYSYPNTITDSYLNSRGHTHAWFSSWDTGYTVTVKRTDNNNPIELYGIFENSAHTRSGCIVVSHVEAESSNAWEYLQNQLDFIVPATKYKMTVITPVEGAVFKFGDNVLFEVMIADDFGNPGTGASVTVNSPTGAPISLIETPAGSGIYVNTYTLLPTDPVGTWAISFVASIEGEFPKRSVPVIIPADQTPPTMTVVTPRETPPEALQDGVTLKATVSDPSGVDWVKFSIRETDGTIVDPSFESMSLVHISGDTWQLPFNTYVPKLPDGNYLFIVNASDTFDNEGSKTVLFSIRNWASLKLLPATTSNKAGRTMPVKFSLRVYETVDPAKPFVYNEQLTIKIYQKGYPNNILQTSTYGTGSRNYRIDVVGELYITNFKTLPTPMTYVVEIYRKDMLIGSFEFKTVK